MARLHELASRAPELNGVTPTGNVVVGHQPGRNGRPAQPNTVLGHGAQEPTLITADRPVTFWTQGGYAIHADVGRLAESFTVGGSRASEDLVKAWILWSDHVSRGGTASDFGDLAALEGLGYGATGVFELEGAHSVLPGTRFPEMNISPEHETRPPDGVRTQVSPEPNAPGVHAKLSTILEEIPGSGVVTVLACRGDRVNHPASKTSR